MSCALHMSYEMCINGHSHPNRTKQSLSTIYAKCNWHRVQRQTKQPVDAVAFQTLLRHHRYTRQRWHLALTFSGCCHKRKFCMFWLMFQTNITQDDKVDFLLLNKQHFGENILQIEIQSVGTDELLLSLTNNAIQIHRIAVDAYDICSSIKIKEASVFASNVFENPCLQVCVGGSRQLHLLRLKNNNLQYFRKPKPLEWLHFI